MSTQNARRCRVCHSLVEVQYSVTPPQGERLTYYICGCGTFFHELDVDPKIYSEKYFETFRKDVKFFEERLKHVQRCFFPLIEELLYGRECLDIGYGFEESVYALQARGWVAVGMDIASEGDFEKEQFQEGKLFDLVILSHVVPAFKDPVKALHKAAGLVRPGGLIMVVSPDPSVALRTGYLQFGHWSLENRTMMSKDRTILELARAGMHPTPIVNVTNTAKRFLYSNDFYLIMRKELTE